MIRAEALILWPPFAATGPFVIYCARLLGYWTAKREYARVRE